MSPDTIDLYVAALVPIAALAPFVWSFAVAAGRRELKPRSHSDYFLYERALTPEEFLSTSVGYGLQVAAIFLFIDWTLAYGLAALFVPAFWYGGYVIMATAVRRGYLDKFLTRPSASGDEGRKLPQVATIHGFVGQMLHSTTLTITAPHPRSIATAVKAMALVTILGLAGTLIAEMDYVTQFVIHVVGETFTEHSDISTEIGITQIIIHIAILGFALSYVLIGGFKAVVATDRHQVPLSYAAFAVVTFGVFILLGENDLSSAPILGGALAIIAGFIFYAIGWQRLRLDRMTGGESTFRDFIPLAAGVVGCVVGLYYILTARGSVNSSFPLLWPGEGSVFAGFGLWGLASLAWANMFWQFIDVSSLQRLQAVSGGSDVTSMDQVREKVILGLNASGRESAGTWVLAIVLALGLGASGVTGSSELVAYFEGMTGAYSLLLPIFVLAITTFMVSTIDGFISAISFVSYYDVLGSKAQDESDKHLKRARSITVISVVVVYAMYLAARLSLEGQDGAIGLVLYTVYGAQSSVGLVVLIALFRRQWLNAPAVVLSVVAGAIAAYLSVFAEAPPPFIPEHSWWVIPPLAALLASGVAYIAGTLVHLASRRSTHKSS